MDRQSDSSISIIGPAIAAKITGVRTCKILVPDLGRNMQFHVLSMDAPLHFHGRNAFPGIVNGREDSSHRSLPRKFLFICEDSHIGVL